MSSRRASRFGLNMVRFHWKESKVGSLHLVDPLRVMFTFDFEKGLLCPQINTEGNCTFDRNGTRGERVAFMKHCPWQLAGKLCQETPQLRN